MNSKHALFASLVKNKILLELTKEEHFTLTTLNLNEGEQASTNYLWDLINTKYAERYTLFIKQSIIESDYILGKRKVSRRIKPKNLSFSDMEHALDCIPLLEPIYYMSIFEELNLLFTEIELKEINTTIGKLAKEDQFTYLKDIYNKRSKITWEALTKKIKSQITNDLLKLSIKSVAIENPQI